MWVTASSAASNASIRGVDAVGAITRTCSRSMGKILPPVRSQQDRACTRRGRAPNARFSGIGRLWLPRRCSSVEGGAHLVGKGDGHPALLQRDGYAGGGAQEVAAVEPAPALDQ